LRVHQIKEIKLKKILFITFTFFAISCAPAFVTYGEKIASDDSLKEHHAYYMKEYEGTKRDEGTIAYISMLEANLYLPVFDLTINELKNDSTNNILLYVSSVRSGITIMLGQFSSSWRTQISNHVRAPGMNVDFSTALAIKKKEYNRMGVYDKLDDIKLLLKDKIKTLDNNDYPKTYEVYSLLTQLISQCESPSGSLLTFGQKVNDINSNIDKILSLAELEFE